MHKRQIIHDFPPHANHHDGPTSSCSIRGCNYTALHTRALQHRIRRAVLPNTRKVKQLSDLLCVGLRVQAALDLVRESRGDELLRKRQSLGLEICNHEGMRAACSCCSEREESNGSCAAYYGAATQGETSGFDAVHDDGEGLEKRAFSKGYVWW